MSLASSDAVEVAEADAEALERFRQEVSARMAELLGEARREGPPFCDVCGMHLYECVNTWCGDRLCDWCLEWVMGIYQEFRMGGNTNG